MDAILFKMLSRSIIIFAMVITLLYFLIKRKKFHNILGVFHLVKYFAVKKLEIEKCDKR